MCTRFYLLVKLVIPGDKAWLVNSRHNKIWHNYVPTKESIDCMM